MKHTRHFVTANNRARTAGSEPSVSSRRAGKVPYLARLPPAEGCTHAPTHARTHTRTVIQAQVQCNAHNVSDPSPSAARRPQFQQFQEAQRQHRAAHTRLRLPLAHSHARASTRGSKSKGRGRAEGVQAPESHARRHPDTHHTPAQIDSRHTRTRATH